MNEVFYRDQKKVRSFTERGKSLALRLRPGRAQGGSGDLVAVIVIGRSEFLSEDRFVNCDESQFFAFQPVSNRIDRDVQRCTLCHGEQPRISSTNLSSEAHRLRLKITLGQVSSVITDTDRGVQTTDPV